MLLTDLNRDLEQMKQTLPAELPPLLVVQFIDERHVRVFGRHSLFEAVMQRLGLRNAWQGETNAWGFSVASLEQFLSIPEARLVVVDPIPVGVSERLQEPGLWQHLPLVQQAPVLHLPAVWSFGGVLAARRFATLLSEALQKDAREIANETFISIPVAATDLDPAGADPFARLLGAGPPVAERALVADPLCAQSG